MSQSEVDTVNKIIIPRLEELGWNESDFHYEVSYPEGRCDILYKDRGRNLVVLEAKKPKLGRSKAFEDAKRAAKHLKAPIAIGLDGTTFLDTFNLNKKQPLVNREGNEITHNDFNLLSINNIKKFIRDPNFLQKRIKNHKELIGIFNSLNRFGKDLGLSVGLERVETFAKIIFIKMLVDNDQYLDPDDWELLLNSPDEKIVERLNYLIKSESISDFSIGEINLDSSKSDSIRKVLELLDSVDFNHRYYDAHSTLFQVFLSERARGGGTNDLGQYFTPDNVIDLLFDLSEYEHGLSVYDPYCGTGGILCKFFFRAVSKEKEANEAKSFAKKYLYGTEITKSIADLAKMNMVIAGDGHTNIAAGDSLIEGNPYVRDDKKFDIVVTNMPFVPSTPSQVKKNYFVYSGDSSVSHFIEHCLNRCKRGGRVVIIVARGFLTGQTETFFRRNLLQEFDLKAIYNLFSGAFDPYTPSRSSVLIIDKKKPNEDGVVDFFNVKSPQDLKIATEYHGKNDRYENGYYKISKKAILGRRDCSLIGIISPKIKEGYCRIRDLASYVDRATTKVKEPDMNLRKLTTPNAIEDGIKLIETQSNKRVESGSADSFNYELQKNAIVVSRLTNQRKSQSNRYIGSAMVGNDSGHLITQEYYQLIPKSIEDIYFILFHLRTKEFQEEIVEFAKGTSGQQRIEVDWVLDGIVPLPTKYGRENARDSLDKIEYSLSNIQENTRKVEEASSDIYNQYSENS